MMQQPNPMSATGIGAIARGMPQGMPQPKPQPAGIALSSINEIADAQGTKTIPDGLKPLLALEQALSQVKAAQNQQMLQQQIPQGTIQDQYVSKADSIIQQAKEVAATSADQERKKQAAVQQLIAGIAKAPGAQQMPGVYAGGGIVAFQNRGEVPDPLDAARQRRRVAQENLYKFGFRQRQENPEAFAAAQEELRAAEKDLSRIEMQISGGPAGVMRQSLSAPDTGDETTRLQSRFPAPQQAAPQQTAPTAPQAPNAPQQGAPAMRMPPAQVTSKVPAALGAGIAQGPAAQVLKPGAMGQGISPGPLEQATEQSAIDLAKMRPRAEIEAARQRRSQTMDPALQADRAEKERALKEFEAFTKPDPERQKREAIYAMLRGYAQPVPGGGGISQYFLNAGAAGNRYQQAQRDMELKNMLERQRRRGEITGADVKSAEALFKAGEDTYQPSLQAQAAGARAGTDLLTSRQTAATAAADRASREREAAANRAVQLKVAEIQAAARNDPQSKEALAVARVQQAINASPLLKQLAERARFDPEAAAEYRREEQRLYLKLAPELLVGRTPTGGASSTRSAADKIISGG